MHARGPWLNGKLKNGWTGLYSALPFSHLSGMNTSGREKYSGRRQVTWFWVTTIACGKQEKTKRSRQSRFSFYCPVGCGTHARRHSVSRKNTRFSQYPTDSHGQRVYAVYFFLDRFRVSRLLYDRVRHFAFSFRQKSMRLVKHFSLHVRIARNPIEREAHGERHLRTYFKRRYHVFVWKASERHWSEPPVRWFSKRRIIDKNALNARR